MSRSQARVLKFLLQNPGATASEIAEGLKLTEQAVRDQLRPLLVEDIVQQVYRESKRNVRFIIAKHFLNEVEIETPRDLIGQKCQARFERELFESYRSALSSDHDPRSKGSFDVASTIHAAVVTDPQMRITNCSPRFEDLVRQTTPQLLERLREKSLYYFGPPETESWFSSLNDLKAIDWEHGAICSGVSTELMSNLWDQWVAKGGYIDGFSFRVEPSGRQPLYLELYLAPQRSFLGHQSMIMNVGERVAATRTSNTKEQYYANMHHEFRQPLQTICALEEQLHKAQELPPDQIRDKIEKIGRKLSIAVNACMETLALFPSRPNNARVDVPLLGALLTAADEVNRKYTCKLSIPDERMFDDRGKYFVTTIPVLHQIAIAGFLRNAVTHGRSEHSVILSHRENLDGGLELIISDRGKGMPLEKIEHWNQLSDELRYADVSDLDKYDGLRLAIMGVKTAGGKVTFSQTARSKPHGLTVTLYFPVKVRQ